MTAAKAALPAQDGGSWSWKVPVTVLMPVKDEAENLPEALRSVAWADTVVVVDSHSSDGTADIARAGGATVVQFDYDRSGPKKKAWALTNLSFHHDWILILDGDERVTPQLAHEIERAVQDPAADGYYIDREFIFMDRSLRCFRPNWNLRLFRAGRGRIEDLGLHGLPETGDNEIHEHIEVDGEVRFLRATLLHQDYRGITAWVARHNQYATWEAHLYRKFRREAIGAGPIQFVRLNAFDRKRVLRRLWVRLPARPLIRFAVWFGLRRGFLDGWVGFVFCTLMSWYELLIGLKVRELDRARRACPDHRGTSAAAQADDHTVTTSFTSCPVAVEATSRSTATASFARSR